MGLFNFFMKGIGFSDKEGSSKPKKTTKEATPANSEQPQSQDRFGDFEKGLAGSFATQQIDSSNIDLSSVPFGASGKNVLIYAPKSDKDLQLLIECLRRKESCIVNLKYLDTQAATKVLDFLSGAVYALRGTIKRLQEELFLLTPEGVNVMIQNNN